ncbi:unnamed protein product [Fraxinus pennsylvanica]|uniref:Uncharacterized protein n=1 Tax=Fraxinus pennsylvanica TaxID=56036 RepID=A0AAD1ZSF0_9LAMI|nr:unnamed protein product [Fraxinus pennsylvanica]
MMKVHLEERGNTLRKGNPHRPPQLLDHDLQYEDEEDPEVGEGDEEDIMSLHMQPPKTYSQLLKDITKRRKKSKSKWLDTITPGWRLRRKEKLRWIYRPTMLWKGHMKRHSTFLRTMSQKTGLRDQPVSSIG